MLLRERFIDLRDLEYTMRKQGMGDDFQFYKAIFLNEEEWLKECTLEKPCIGFFLQDDNGRRLLYRTAVGTKEDVQTYAKKLTTNEYLYIYRLNNAESISDGHSH